MKIKLINPNTTQSMTDKMALSAQGVLSPGTELIAVSPAFGPPSIEGWYDEAMAVPGLLSEVMKGEREGVDAYVIACFGDPGLYAARECAKGPVLGIAEAAMHAASMIASRFTVVTTLSRTVGMAWHLAERYGMTRFCKNVRAIDVAVLALDEPGSEARQLVLDACRLAMREDGAEVIVLGCAGMVDFCQALQRELGIPVIDGVTTALKMAESLVSLGLGTAKSADFAAPLAKTYDGLMAPFSPSAFIPDDVTRIKRDRQ